MSMTYEVIRNSSEIKIVGNSNVLFELSSFLNVFV